MASSITEVTDLFLSRINDSRLTTLFTTSGSDALNTYLEPHLLDSIVDFGSICTQTILDYSTTTQSFSVDLTLTNKIILSRIMVKYWLAKEVKEINQMRLHLQDKDFRTFSEQQLLKAKSELLIQVTEEISQLLSSYGLDNLDWDQWDNQIFR